MIPSITIGFFCALLGDLDGARAALLWQAIYLARYFRSVAVSDGRSKTVTRQW